MGADKRRSEEYLYLINSKKAQEELGKSKVYRALFYRASDLIDEGHDPFMVAMALASLTSVILESIDERSGQRPA
jgi:hypothetical protein